MKTLKQLREKLGRTPLELTSVAGINVESYYDLEMNPGELDNGASVRSVALIARELGVKPSVLYGDVSEGSVSLRDLASLIRRHLDHSGEPLADFGNRVGYAVDAALANPDEFGDFNADGLRAVSAAVHVNWCDVLDHLLDPP